MSRYFSIRANGETLHNNPSTHAYRQGELPDYPKREFDYVDHCLKEGFARIGWPGTGNLLQYKEIPHHVADYPEDIPELNRRQLGVFRQIAHGDVIILPRKGVDLYYVGTVNKTYSFHDELPFECAHRVGVIWDRSNNSPTEYSAADFGLSRVGAPFIYALCEIKDENVIRRIDEARNIHD